MATQRKVLRLEVVRRITSNTALSVEELPELAPLDAAWRALNLATPKRRQRAIAALVLACSALASLDAEAKGALQRLIETKDTDAVQRTIATALLAHIEADFGADGLPLDAQATIRIVLRRRGMTVAELAREGGQPFIKMKDKVNGLRRLSRADKDWLEASEVVLRLKAWRIACKRAYDGYRLQIKNQRRKIRISRDSHLPVLAILKSPQPLDAMKMAVRGLRVELAKLAPHTMAYAETLRDLIAIELEMQTGFRRRTILALDWIEDGYR